MEKIKNIIGLGMDQLYSFLMGTGMAGRLVVSKLETIITVILATGLSIGEIYFAEITLWQKVLGLFVVWSFAYLVFYLMGRSFQLCQRVCGIILGDSILNRMVSLLLGFVLGIAIVLEVAKFFNGIPVVGPVMNIIFVLSGYLVFFIQLCFLRA